MKARFAKDGQSFTDSVFDNDSMRIIIHDSRYDNYNKQWLSKYGVEVDIYHENKNIIKPIENTKVFFPNKPLKEENVVITAKIQESIEDANGFEWGDTTETFENKRLISQPNPITNISIITKPDITINTTTESIEHLLIVEPTAINSIPHNIDLDSLESQLKDFNEVDSIENKVMNILTQNSKYQNIKK